MIMKLLLSMLAPMAQKWPALFSMAQGAGGANPQTNPLSDQSAVNFSKYALIVSISSAAISAITAYFQFRTHRARRPAVIITLSDLPPYQNDRATTYLAVKNVGTGATSRKLDITVSCSWMPFLSYRLNLPSEAYCLEPNEEYWWRFRMNDRVVPNSTVTVAVKDSRRHYWKLQEHIPLG